MSYIPLNVPHCADLLLHNYKEMYIQDTPVTAVIDKKGNSIMVYNVYANHIYTGLEAIET